MSVLIICRRCKQVKHCHLLANDANHRAADGLLDELVKVDDARRVPRD